MIARYNFNSRVSPFIVILIIVLTLVSTCSKGQADSMVARRDSSIRYFGYDLMVSSQAYRLESNIPALDGLHVTREGASAGVIIGNKIGNIRSTVGVYYSSPSVPYSIDVLEAGLSANLFFLRLYKKVPSTIEPYVSISSKAVRSSFFGCDFEKNSPANRSVSDGALFGRIVSWQAFVGIGAEYQMRNERNQFLNFFGEVRYGQSIHNYRSISALEQTATRSATSCAFGISFGLFH